MKRVVVLKFSANRSSLQKYVSSLVDSNLTMFQFQRQLRRGSLLEGRFWKYKVYRYVHAGRSEALFDVVGGPSLVLCYKHACDSYAMKKACNYATPVLPGERRQAVGRKERVMILFTCVRCYKIRTHRHLRREHMHF